MIQFKKKYCDLFLIVIGISLCIYPCLRNLYEFYLHQKIMREYRVEIKHENKVDLDFELEKAREYNTRLFNQEASFIESQQDIMNYESLLNINHNGIMAELVIPKISVDLPVYHGTDEVVLTKGIGHVEKSSLPVGGKHTRCLLTGHRGLPSSMLFTRLDELKIGDTFYIQALHHKIWYQICDIKTILPEETEELKIIENKDLVSLITCTPYGINTHRLVVTGNRIYPKNENVTKQKPTLPSLRECVFFCLPFILIIVFGCHLKKRKDRRVFHDH